MVSEEKFEFRRELPEFSDRLTITPVGVNELRLDVADRYGQQPWRRAIMELPAADARRLRDWLRERYPHEEDGK